MFYKRVVRPILFQLDPEEAHGIATKSGSLFVRIPGAGAILHSCLGYDSPRLRTEVAGLSFPNPVGMAAGFDKEGDLYPLLAAMGFGFVESGTFTALEQPGNPRPRLFRFPEAKALVNRMGFNNPGSERVARVIRNHVRTVPRGINIGKSKLAPLDQASDDYLKSLRTLSPFGEYVAVNVSSPNTPGLRSLQEKEPLRDLLRVIRDALRKIPVEGMTVAGAKVGGARKPLFVKIAPDLDEPALRDILEVVQELDLDGIILTNTTVDKGAVPRARGMEGGLSGSPLRERSTDIIRRAHGILEGKKAIIGVGGIFSGEDALEKILAGASLIQVYTGFVYEGPSLPGRISRFLDAFCEKRGVQLSELVGAGNKII